MQIELILENSSGVQPATSVPSVPSVQAGAAENAPRSQIQGSDPMNYGNRKTEETSNRPAGITTLAILLFLDGAIRIGVLAAMTIRPQIWTGVNPQLQQFMPGANTAMGETTFFLSCLFIVAALAVGFGLWSLMSWARWVLLILTGLALGNAFLAIAEGLLFAPSHLVMKAAFSSAFLVRTVINFVVFMYLLQPQVKEVFSSQSAY